MPRTRSPKEVITMGISRCRSALMAGMEMAQWSETTTLSISLIGISRRGVSGVGNSMRILSLMRLARVPGVVRQSVGIDGGSIRLAWLHKWSQPKMLDAVSRARATCSGEITPAKVASAPSRVAMSSARPATGIGSGQASIGLKR